MRDPGDLIETSQKAVASRLNLIMAAYGESQVSFAAKLGVSPQAVQNWRTNQFVSRQGAVAILRVCGISIDWLLVGLEHKLDEEVAQKIQAARISREKS